MPLARPVRNTATKFAWQYCHSLFQTTQADPATFVGVTIVLDVVALLAALGPARRATKTDR